MGEIMAGQQVTHSIEDGVFVVVDGCTMPDGTYLIRPEGDTDNERAFYAHIVEIGPPPEETVIEIEPGQTTVALERDGDGWRQA